MLGGAPYYMSRHESHHVKDSGGGWLTRLLSGKWSLFSDSGGVLSEYDVKVLV